jgi:hypothetical protein
MATLHGLHIYAKLGKKKETSQMRKKQGLVMIRGGEGAEKRVSVRSEAMSLRSRDRESDE